MDVVLKIIMLHWNSKILLGDDFSETSLFNSAFSDSKVAPSRGSRRKKQGVELFYQV